MLRASTAYLSCNHHETESSHNPRALGLQESRGGAPGSIVEGEQDMHGILDLHSLLKDGMASRVVAGERDDRILGVARVDRNDAQTTPIPVTCTALPHRNTVGVRSCLKGPDSHPASNQTCQNSEYRPRQRRLGKATCKLDEPFPRGWGTCSITSSITTEARGCSRGGRVAMVPHNTSCPCLQACSTAHSHRYS